MPKAYIVVEWDFYYTDECFAELGPGFPQAVFTDLQKAEAHAEELNVKRFAGLNLLDYCLTREEISELSHAKLTMLIGGDPSNYAFEEQESIPAFSLTQEDYSKEACWASLYKSEVTEEDWLSAYSNGIVIPARLPEAQLREIASLFTFKFYKVIEFEVTE